MWIVTSEGEKKKSISRSTVELAVRNALEAGGVVKGPKALNVPGAHSYMYPILVRFGVVSALSDFQGRGDMVTVRFYGYSLVFFW